MGPDFATFLEMQYSWNIIFLYISFIHMLIESILKDHSLHYTTGYHK